MKKKFITKQNLPVCGSALPVMEEDIHTQLANTIAERKRIIQYWDKVFHPAPVAVEKDIHFQLAETIAEHQQKMKQWEWLFVRKHSSHFGTADKRAA